MASSVSVRIATAHSSLAGTAVFTDSSTAKRRRIQFPEEWARSGPEEYIVIGMAACGLELSTRELFTYTRESQMYLDCRRVSQARELTYCLKIAKAVCGSQAGMASIAFATLLSLRFL